jgi:precorrin-2 dehydrogenase/sirohydrochlorin ferrochelatase
LSNTGNFFPMLVRLAGRKCLVVGAGKIAADKVAGLLIYGAQVEVVSPRAVERIQELVREGKIRWRRREFSSRDVNGAFLVVAATNSSIVNQAVFRACNAGGVLCNAVDDPPHCDFFYPAVVRRGPLQIAISTNGHSPALAARLRRELENQFGPEWSDWVEHVGKLRREILDKRMSAKARRERLLEMASPGEFEEFVRRGPLPKKKTAGVPARKRTRRQSPHKSRS